MYSGNREIVAEDDITLKFAEIELMSNNTAFEGGIDRGCYITLNASDVLTDFKFNVMDLNVLDVK